MLVIIPRFRLPVHIVKAKVAQLERLGVQFVFETRVGQDITVQDLLQQEYHVVCLGTGAGFEPVVNLPGADLKGVYLATEFLARTNLDKAHTTEEQAPIQMGERVAIFGAGHAAVDCARTAVRMGAQKVTCFYRGEMDMLCRLEDRLAAQEENARFVTLTEPVGLIGDERGHVVQVQCQRVRPSRRDGQRHLIPIEGSRYTVDTDLVVLAPERGPDRMIVEDTPGLEIEAGGWVVSDEETGQTTRRGVFAAGDNTGESHLAVFAIAEGRRVAASIHRYLSS
jgi:glutamate synthase (NADPH/NADH) small chain